ncbi:hypothetical protein DFQ28_004171, partial [Apophysomyces sp. BC1034]
MTEIGMDCLTIDDGQDDERTTEVYATFMSMMHTSWKPDGAAMDINEFVAECQGNDANMNNDNDDNKLQEETQDESEKSRIESFAKIMATNSNTTKT